MSTAAPSVTHLLEVRRLAVRTLHVIVRSHAAVSRTVQERYYFLKSVRTSGEPWPVAAPPEMPRRLPAPRGGSSPHARSNPHQRTRRACPGWQRSRLRLRRIHSRQGLVVRLRQLLRPVDNELPLPARASALSWSAAMYPAPALSSTSLAAPTPFAMLVRSSLTRLSSACRCRRS